MSAPPPPLAPLGVYPHTHGVPSPPRGKTRTLFYIYIPPSPLMFTAPGRERSLQKIAPFPPFEASLERFSTSTHTAPFVFSHATKAFSHSHAFLPPGRGITNASQYPHMHPLVFQPREAPTRVGRHARLSVSTPLRHSCVHNPGKRSPNIHASARPPQG